MRTIAVMALLVVLAAGCQEQEDCGDCSPDPTPTVVPGDEDGSSGPLPSPS